MTSPLHTLLSLLTEPAPELPAQPLLEAAASHVLHMDNLDAMARIPADSIDFLYIDPPFASDASYQQRIRVGDRSVTRTAYTDTWPNGLHDYLRFLVPRLRHMHTLLSPTGSICVHLDSHSSHYIKIALDAIFGQELLINEVIWRYGKMSNTSRRFPQNHDTLLIYGRTPDWYFSPVLNAPSEYRARFLRDLTGNQVLYGTVKDRSDKLLLRRIAARQRELGRPLRDDDVLFDFESERKVQDDVFTDISIIRGNAHEGAGYATQKPKQLVGRLINALCPPEGTVADFFCGSGTTAVAAQELGRRFIVADSGAPAIGVTRSRLEGVPYTYTSTNDPMTFVVDGDRRIIDFRIDELGLSDEDASYIAQIVASNPELLIGESGEELRDVFGRTAAVSDQVC